MSSEQKIRLDQLLVSRGLASSRARARDLIKRGAVMAAGKTASKAGQMVDRQAPVAVAGEFPYVSRGALKLKAALAAFGFDPAGRVALDTGASTGGFTQVLLEGGARRVYAVDVGHGQLHASLRENARVINLEGTDARKLDRGKAPEAVAAITIDVSFISLLKVMPPVLELAAPGAWLVALIKPQFEAGREAVGKGGIVRDEQTRQAAVERVRAFLAAQPGWRVIGVMPSPLTGQDGNQEFLLGGRYQPDGIRGLK